MLMVLNILACLCEDDWLQIHTYTTHPAAVLVTLLIRKTKDLI